MKISTAARNAADDAAMALCNGGTLKFYTGSAPTNPSDAASGTLLATLTMNATAFAASVAGVATANAIAPDSNCAASGTAGYWRILSAGAVCIMQGSVGTSGAEINLNSLSITSGGTCAVTALTVTMPAT